MERANNLFLKEECPECGSQALIRDPARGEKICAHCGLVISEKEMDKGPEWRAFGPEQSAKRTRGAAYLETPTTLDPHGRDAFGKKIPLSKRNEMQRLRKWQRRSFLQNRRDRNFITAEEELNRLCEKLHLPSQALNLARKIYRSSFERELVRGRSINGMVAASIAIACRQLQIPRSLKDISSQSQADKKEINRDFRLIVQELNLRNPLYDMAILINQVGDKLDLSLKTQQLAFEILTQAKLKKTTAGKGPRGLAAAALYIACLQTKDSKTQREISKESGVTEVTIRNRYQDLKKNLEINLDKKKKPKKPTSFVKGREKKIDSNQLFDLIVKSLREE